MKPGDEAPTWLVVMLTVAAVGVFVPLAPWIAMFGGVELIGGWGLLMGPLVVRLAKEALDREIRGDARSGNN